MRSYRVGENGRMAVSYAVGETVVRIDVAINLGALPLGANRHMAKHWRFRGVTSGDRGKKRTVYLEWFVLSNMAFTTFEAIKRWLIATDQEPESKVMRINGIQFADWWTDRPRMLVL